MDSCEGREVIVDGVSKTSTWDQNVEVGIIANSIYTDSVRIFLTIILEIEADAFVSKAGDKSPGAF